MKNFKEYINENRINIADIIKAFRQAKIIVKMFKNNILVGRMDSTQEAEDVMKNFKVDYNIKQGTEDKELVYIELKIK